MSALRSYRRFLAHERFLARCEKIGGRTTMKAHGFSHPHAIWFWRAQAQGRWAPNGIRDVRLKGWNR